MASTAEADFTPTKCYPSRPCNRWRTCARCARRRQAKIADAVADLNNRVGRLRWHIMYPHTIGPDALRAVRADWLRTTAPAGAIWTIEQSKKTGSLHLNMITAAEIDQPPKNANHWHQTITGDVRNVGAYIAKKGQMPHPEDYSGNLYGRAGQLWNILANQKQNPAIAAAAAQYAINSAAMLDRAAQLQNTQRQKTYEELKAEYDKINAQPEPTKAEYRAIAARWLPDLLDWKDKIRPRSQLELTREFMQREGE